MPRWRIDIVRKEAEHVGIVTAPNIEEARARAANLFRIAPALQNKLTITKLYEPKAKGKQKSRRSRV